MIMETMTGSVTVGVWSGLNMSKKELKKWEKKLKLYTVLNGKHDAITSRGECQRCKKGRNVQPHAPRWCPEQVLMSNSKGRMKLLPASWWGTEKLNGYWFCSEWIKYV